ncbi:hypothetical protein Tco_1493941 [Tanacetum coccineum]
MSSITDIKSVLTQKALKKFCETFHIPDEVHPQLPSPNQIIHEMPTGKIGVYTRFFEYANFRLPFSTFLVNVLKHYRIYISQLSVIAAAKVSHFEILCRVHGFDPTVKLFRCFYVNSKNKGWMSFSKRQGNDAVCYTKPLDSLKGWNDHFFWVDEFACPTSFLWHTGKSVSKDPYPKSLNLTSNIMLLLLHIRLRSIKMDLLSFIRTAVPTKVRIGERQRAEDKPKLLDTTVGRVVPLLPIAPDRAESELEASVDKLFDEGGSVVDAGEPSHTAKRLNDDHGIPGGTVVGGKSRSAVQRLLAGAVQNAEVMGEAMPTLPFVTSSVSATPECEGGDHTESLDGANLRTIGAPQRFVISSDSSYHSSVNVAEAEVDSVVRTSMPIMMSITIITPTAAPAVIAKDKLAGSSVFGVDSSSAGGSHPTPGGFSDCTGSDFLIGGIRTVIDPDSNLQKIYVPQWNVTNGMEHDQPFAEFNVGAARQMSLRAEVRMRAEYNIKEKRRLKSTVDEKAELLKVRDGEIENLKAQLLLQEAEAAEAIRVRAEASKFEVIERSIKDEVKTLKDHNATLEKEKNYLGVKVVYLAASVKVKEQEIADLDALVTSVKLQKDNLVDQVHELETSSAKLQEKVAMYENCSEQLEKFQDEQIKIFNEKLDKLYVDFVEMALHLEEKFYPHLLTTISGRRWLLTQGIELAIAKCLNSTEYLSALGAAISKAVEKGMQDGLSAGITHGTEGRALTDVAAYNPSAEADYMSALQRLQSVNLSLISELRSNKDASIETIMNLLRLEDTLAERLGLTESQPHVDKLMVPIHHSSDHRVVGASALSLSLDVSSSRVRKIKENIANHRSALRDVFVHLSEPLSVTALTGTEGTSDVMPATADTTTALSVTFAFASSVPPISTVDYEVVHADSQESTGADPFPNVDDGELNIS